MLPTTFFSILRVLWIIRTVRAAAAHAALWQQKEYRWDRMRAHLLLPEVRHVRPYIVPLLEIVAGFFLFSPLMENAGAWMLLGIYAAETLRFIQEVAQRRVRRPDRTARALLTVGGTFIGTAVIAILGIGLASSLGARHSLLPLIIADRLLPLVTAASVAMLHPFVRATKERLFRKAQQYRETLLDLTVIGITGSYGKTTTKELVAAVLGDPAHVVKTAENTNTEIGVARTVLRSLRPGQRFFVCEMGAYRRGEIRRMTEIVKPTIGVLTGIAPQHLALFGSMDALLQAKYELIEAIPASGTALFNADDPHCRALAERTTHCRVLRCGTLPTADIRCQVLKWDEKGTQLELTTAAGSVTVSLRLLGAHLGTNLALAVGVATALNIPLADIAEQLKQLTPLSRTMEPRTLRDGTFVVDDSYSANPRGVLSAIDTLRGLPQSTKIVVLTSMIELGSAAEEAHQEIGVSLRTLPNAHVFLMGNSYLDDIQGREGGTRGAQTIFRSLRTDQELLDALAPLRGTNTAILIEGRIPTRAYERLLAS